MVWIVGIGAWFAVGLLGMILIGFLDWKDGKDLKVSDLGPFCLCVVLGPIAITLISWEFVVKLWLSKFHGKITGDTVIIPGSRSAKAYKILRQEQWPPN